MFQQMYVGSSSSVITFVLNDLRPVVLTLMFNPHDTHTHTYTTAGVRLPVTFEEIAK